MSTSTTYQQTAYFENNDNGKTKTVKVQGTFSDDLPYTEIIDELLELSYTKAAIKSAAWELVDHDEKEL